MAAAAARPSRMARITVEPPRTTSPPANTLGMLVSPSSSITTLPRLVKLWGGALHGGVGALADGHHHRIYRHAEFRPRHGNRRRPA